MEHVILDPYGSRYDDQDPRQLERIQTQNRGGLA
jgi:hypothetical protein